jgi:hypothetical protein
VKLGLFSTFVVFQRVGWAKQQWLLARQNTFYCLAEKTSSVELYMPAHCDFRT